jgi:hypothetical protein
VTKHQQASLGGESKELPMNEVAESRHVDYSRLVYGTHFIRPIRHMAALPITSASRSRSS